MIFGQAAREFDQIHRAFGDDDVVALEHFKIEKWHRVPPFHGGPAPAPRCFLHIGDVAL